MSWRLCAAVVVTTGWMMARADEPVFWRIGSSGTSVITSVTADGMLTWSNSAPGENELIQRASILSPTADWQDYTRIPSTGILASARAFDPNPPNGMVLIPGGAFIMGATTNVGHESYPGETPQHTVYVSEFYMEGCEVTKLLWDTVRNWSLTNGYSFDNGGFGKAADHPVQTINWYDAVKWCNARSEREGLTPCYTTNGLVYRSDDSTNVVCNWSANGYRLPTEAEWERAARGGAEDTRFPWIDYTNRISHARANYFGATNLFSYDLSTSYHPAYSTGGAPYTSPVGSFAPNAYGLFDMAGNVWEWCWDWYSSAYYPASPSVDPRGPDGGAYRMLRGGGWSYNAALLRNAKRDVSYVPTTAYNSGGLRCVRTR